MPTILHKSKPESPFNEVPFSKYSPSKGHLLKYLQHEISFSIPTTVRPRDTRPQAARTSTMHDFELGPKNFEMHEFMW